MSSTVYGKGAKPEEAVGYVGYVANSQADRDAVQRELMAFAAWTKMGYATTFIDRDVMANDRPNSAWYAMIAHLRMAREQTGLSTAVLIYSPSHLSLTPDIRHWKRDMIIHAGGRLVKMSDDPTFRVTALASV